MQGSQQYGEVGDLEWFERQTKVMQLQSGSVQGLNRKHGMTKSQFLYLDDKGLNKHLSGLYKEKWPSPLEKKQCA